MSDLAMPSRTPRPRPLSASGLVVLVLMLSMTLGILGADQATAAPPVEAAPAEVQTEPAEATANGFRLKGRLNPEGLPTTYYFLYSKDGGVQCELEPLGCGLITAVGGPLTGDTQQEAPPLEVTGLTPGETYSYSLIARNAKGIAYGQELTFTPASVESKSTSSTTQTAATPQGSLDPIGVMLPFPAAPASPGGTSKPPTTSKPPAAKAALKLSNAIRACAKKPKSRRAACERLARKKYGVAARKK